MPVGVNRGKPIIFASFMTLVISFCPSWLHTSPVPHSAKKDRIPAPRVQQPHIFLSAASIFVPVYHEFWSLVSPETLYCVLFCRKHLGFMAVGYKRFPPLPPLLLPGNLMGVTITDEPCWENPGQAQLSAWAMTLLCPGPNFVPLWLALFIGINISY